MLSSYVKRYIRKCFWVGVGVVIGWWLADYSRVAQGRRMARLIDALYESALRRADPGNVTWAGL